MMSLCKKLIPVLLMLVFLTLGSTLAHADCTSGTALCVYQTAPPDIQFGSKDADITFHVAASHLTASKSLKLELENITDASAIYFDATKTFASQDVSYSVKVSTVTVNKTYSIKFYDGATLVTSTVPDLVLPAVPILSISEDAAPTFTDTTVTLSLKTNIGTLGAKKIVIEGDDIAGVKSAVQSNVITVPASSTSVTFTATLAGLITNTEYKIRAIDSDTAADIVSSIPDFITGGLDLSNTHWYFTVYYADGTHVDSAPYDTEEICQTNLAQEELKDATVYGVTVGTCYPNVITNPYIQIPVDPNPAVVDGSCIQGEYCLLEPLPLGPNGKITTSIDTNNPEGYINTILSLVLALAGALAVLMIIVGGVRYMGADSVFPKNAGRQQVENAIFGLLLLLGAYAILNTINPNLVNLHIGIKNVTIAISEDGVKPDSTATQSQYGYQSTFKMNGVFSAPIASSLDLANLILDLKNGHKLTQITADTGNKKICFVDDGGITGCTSMNYGEGGIASSASSIENHQTPKGTYVLTSDIRRSTSTNDPQFTVSKTPPTNLGASFWMININGGSSGIGIHGNFNNTLDETYGCIRMYNDDLVLIQPYVFSGLAVVIN